MSYTGQNPRFRSTILTDVGVSSISNPPSGAHRIINRSGTLQVQDSAGVETPIGSGGTVDRISQTGHGFVVGEMLYYTGSAYAKARADVVSTAEIVGMVSRVLDADTFEVTLEGKVTGLSGLTAGTTYFLSASTAGAITATEPSTLGYVSLPVGVAISTTVIYVRTSRGAVVGSVNARTEIALANNTTTNVQSVSAYQAGELSGWVEIDGTTDLKFFVSAPFAKNGANSDYYISPSYVGDTPPVGFSLSITSGGLIQATLPSIAGYVSAKINFALNAPAVGATFPLAIDSTLVQFSTLKAKDSGGFVFQENGGTQIGSWSDAGILTLSCSISNQLLLTGGSNPGSRLRIDRGTSDINQFMEVSFNRLIINRADVPIAGAQTDFAIVQKGSDTQRDVASCSSSGSWILGVLDSSLINYSYSQEFRVQNQSSSGTQLGPGRAKIHAPSRQNIAPSGSGTFENGQTSAIHIIKGYGTGDNAGKRFTDFVVTTESGWTTPTLVLHSSGINSPNTRTYTVDGSNRLVVTLGAGGTNDFEVNVSVFSM